jgi:hypothetical protein
MSIDSPDPVCEAICAKFLDDPRFRMVVLALLWQILSSAGLNEAAGAAVKWRSQ